MNISSREDQLFTSWKTKYPNETFVIDGAPCPESFESSPARCLIILKDVNVDSKDEKADLFDLRAQLATDPHLWWRTIANWCAGISRIHENQYHTWIEINKEDIKRSLKPFAFMQLKKTTGGGTVNADVLSTHSVGDAVYIREQINIYGPKVIICGGVGNNIADVLGYSEWRQTRNGVQYATVDLNGQRTFLIDYMHPSARAAKNIICYGILDAYKEIVEGDSFLPRA